MKIVLKGSDPKENGYRTPPQGVFGTLPYYYYTKIDNTEVHSKFYQIVNNESP